MLNLTLFNLINTNIILLSEIHGQSHIFNANIDHMSYNLTFPVFITIYHSQSINETL